MIFWLKNVILPASPRPHQSAPRNMEETIKEKQGNRKIYHWQKKCSANIYLRKGSDCTNTVYFSKEWQCSSSWSWRVNQRAYKHVFWGVMFHTGAFKFKKMKTIQESDSFVNLHIVRWNIHTLSCQVWEGISEMMENPTTTIILVAKAAYYFHSEHLKYAVCSILYYICGSDFALISDLH